MKELEYPFNGEYLLKKKKSIKKLLLENSYPEMIKKKIAILGGSTTHDIKMILELFLLNEGIYPEFYESEFNQYWQDIMFPNPVLEEFQPDIIYIHTSNRNIIQYPEMSDGELEIEEKLEKEYVHLEEIWKKIEEIYHCPIIQNNFEYPYFRLMGNREAADIHGRINFINRLNQKIYGYAQTHNHFYINDINYLSSAYGLKEWLDPFYWHMYKYALCVPAIPELSYNIFRIIKSLYGKNKKALVLDLDNTLWGGVIGDDGVDNIIIGPEVSMGQAYTEFQEYLKAQKDLGIILNINSKNEYSNAIAGLNHPYSVLKPDDFIVIKANWENKSDNIKAIAQELVLTPESLVFVDDNPAERDIVHYQVPGVAVPQMEKIENYIKSIDEAGYFEVTNFSADDVCRNEMYKANVKRKEVERKFADYKEYLLSLQMEAAIKPFEALYIARIAQLTNKSNQFNLTTRRYSQTEIEDIAKSNCYIHLYGKLQDKYGDNGVVSVVIGSMKQEVLHIDLWIMSCRVLKRDMELAMFDELIKEAKERGIRKIAGYYYPTAKNGMVKEFYKSFGFEKKQEDEKGNTVWIFDIPEEYENKNTVILVNK